MYYILTPERILQELPFFSYHGYQSLDKKLGLKIIFLLVSGISKQDHKKKKYCKISSEFNTRIAQLESNHWGLFLTKLDL